LVLDTARQWHTPDTPQALAGASNVGYVVDTPGFSSLEIEAIPLRELASCFLEFVPFLGRCKFKDCLHAAHDKRGDCAVKARVGKEIHPARYASYLKMIGAAV
jgi:ribosome biogenesis GTPase